MRFAVEGRYLYGSPQWSDASGPKRGSHAMCELLTNFTVFVDPSDRPDVSIERGEATVTMQPAMVLRHDNWGPTPEVALSFGSAISLRRWLAYMNGALAAAPARAAPVEPGASRAGVT